MQMKNKMCMHMNLQVWKLVWKTILGHLHVTRRAFLQLLALNRRKTFIRNKFLCGTNTRLRRRPNPYVHALEP